MRVLLVVHEPEYVEHLTRALEGAGHEVVNTGSLSEAKERRQEGKFQVILCDGKIDSDPLTRVGYGDVWALCQQAKGDRVIMISFLPPYFHELSWVDARNGGPGLEALLAAISNP